MWAQSNPSISAEQSAKLDAARPLTQEVIQLSVQGKFAEAIPLAKIDICSRDVRCNISTAHL